MNHVVFALCVGAVLALQAGAFRHHILSKSWDDAQADCFEYLRIGKPRSELYLAHRYEDDQPTKKLLFCIALNLRVYDPVQNSLHLEAFRRFFKPDSDDKGYVNRTNECLLRVSAPPTETNSISQCSRPYSGALDSVYGTFRCFYHYYGNLHRNTTELSPTVLELDQVLQECALITGLSLKELNSVSSLKDHPSYHNLARCVVLRCGFAAFEHGGSKLLSFD
ncbi:general odorant-binding protein 69-like [Anopheles nili]|uniref:general odorant-binding protein 69-like n=1 Tax=Anopheles nili TaxID=185578 RepID=UPI00237BFF28|nr:general odorant-binding protein 69-like [Anopheles nili]